MTDVTNTNAARAAALAVRDAAAALARRRPLYDGASGEPADEDLAQAIEDLPPPDADTTNWRAEAERLGALLDVSEQARKSALREIARATERGIDDHAEVERLRDALQRERASSGRYMEERNQARLAAQREVGEAMRKLRAERDAALAELAQARDTLTRAGWEYIPDAIGEPIWKPPVNVRMAELRRERDELAARLAEIERAADLDADIIEAQRAVVQQLASRTTCDWPGKCRRQRPAQAAAPERAEPAELLRAVLNTEIARGTLHKLRDGQGTDTPGGRSWLAAFAWAGESPERAEPKPCRCGPDGCSDSTSCPRGER